MRILEPGMFWNGNPQLTNITRMVPNRITRGRIIFQGDTLLSSDTRMASSSAMFCGSPRRACSSALAMNPKSCLPNATIGIRKSARME